MSALLRDAAYDARRAPRAQLTLGVGGAYGRDEDRDADMQARSAELRRLQQRTTLFLSNGRYLTGRNHGKRDGDLLGMLRVGRQAAAHYLRRERGVANAPRLEAHEIMARQSYWRWRERAMRPACGLAQADMLAMATRCTTASDKALTAWRKVA